MSPMREALVEADNPIGLDGIEYVEYATSAPQAVGHVLEMMGFRPIARHRSREVLLYRQGDMNIVVNAHPGVVRGGKLPDEHPRIAAIALRVRDARAAYEYVLERGAWDVPMHAQVMELNIPGIHGPGGAHIYFVDRHREFSIYDVDFTLIPTVDPKPPALGDLHWFGIVQYVGRDRSDDWVEFYRHLFGFSVLPEAERFGILPKGTLLRSPCRQFMVQLVEPDPVTVSYDEEELFHRVGFGLPDVPGTVAELRRRGVEFVESAQTHTEMRGALTRHYLHSLLFELVHDAKGQP
ncbi:MAG: 4-hydroxyphenylpyruvate dioxygenase [Burkholderiales bacterium]|nr:4-hydroxyphenylpyruvate dioxygenase [Burkholderiales bacterium]